MSKPRREFFRDLLALGAFQAFAASPAAARNMASFLDESSLQEFEPRC